VCVCVCVCVCIYPHARYSNEAVLQFITVVECFDATAFRISFLIYLFALL
jgi:hypothetical protein